MGGLKANKTALGIEVQSALDAFNPPDTSDLMPVANLTFNETAVTVENPEYTGTIHKQGDIVAGSNVTLSFDVMLRPPGGVSVPAADTYLPGRVMRACKFSEQRQATAIPVSPEAATSGTTTGMTLGAGAAGTADLYKGLAVRLSGKASNALPRALSAIKSYTAGKVATLPETFGGAYSGNYQIVPQLAYVRDVSETDAPALSIKLWLDGSRYDLINMAVTSWEASVPTSTRDQANIPVIRVTMSGTVYATADEPSPTIPALGSIPLFKDGELWVANKSVGGSSLSINMAARAASPPNPNKADGSDAPELVEVKPTVSLNLNKYLKATFDPRALAIAQSYHSIWARWGYTAGNMVSLLVTDARFSFPNPDVGGDFVTENIDMYVDVADKNIVISFPYPA